jgi:pyruvate/2-oxoglutarate dehydrogenase complex dihydrolipoamide acyltransferase (E2) component
MPTNVVMPQLGESVTEGTVTRWLKNIGDAIKVDEAIVEVSTDKVDTEIPSPVAGVLLEIKAAQDSVIPVGGVMAIIGESGSTPVSAPAPTAVVAPKPEPVIEKPEIGMDVQFGLQKTRAGFFIGLLDIGNAVEHQHVGKRQPRRIRPEEFTAPAGQQFVVGIRIFSHRTK